MTTECTERCENKINKPLHHWTTFINQGSDAMSLTDNPHASSFNSSKRGYTGNMTPHHLETNVITTTHQQHTKQCQFVIHSFKINKPNHIIGYTNNPIVKQQSNNNMPYNQNDSAVLMKIAVKQKTKIKAKLRSTNNLTSQSNNNIRAWLNFQPHHVIIAATADRSICPNQIKLPTCWVTMPSTSSISSLISRNKIDP